MRQSKKMQALDLVATTYCILEKILLVILILIPTKKAKKI